MVITVDQWDSIRLCIAFVMCAVKNNEKFAAGTLLEAYEAAGIPDDKNPWKGITPEYFEELLKITKYTEPMLRANPDVIRRLLPGATEKFTVLPPSLGELSHELPERTGRRPPPETGHRGPPPKI